MSQVYAMFEETGLDPFESEELAAFLTSLETLVDNTAPGQSATLAELLASGPAGVGVANVRPLLARRPRVAVVTALAALGIVATGVAAAANELPPTAQRIVAEFSNRFLPFDFPHPDEGEERRLERTDPGRTAGADSWDGSEGAADSGSSGEPDSGGSDGPDGEGSNHEQASGVGAADRDEGTTVPTDSAQQGDQDERAGNQQALADQGDDADTDGQHASGHRGGDDDSDAAGSSGDGPGDQLENEQTDDVDADTDDSTGEGSVDDQLDGEQDEGTGSGSGSDGDDT